MPTAFFFSLESHRYFAHLLAYTCKKKKKMERVQSCWWLREVMFIIFTILVNLVSMLTFANRHKMQTKLKCCSYWEIKCGVTNRFFSNVVTKHYVMKA